MQLKGEAGLLPGETRMASISKCRFCGADVRSDERNCNNCGEPNRDYVAAEDVPQTVFRPKTIAELKEYCTQRGMPLYRMRFFIGENYQEPKAFGIYQADANRFVVYKNKADGSRSVRYDGPDEAYAVRELFDKLLDECHNRGIYPERAGQISGHYSDGGYVMRTLDEDSSQRHDLNQQSRQINSAQGHRRPSMILIVLILIFLAGFSISIIQSIQENIHTKEQVKAFSESPNTYNSKHIGDHYYTYDVHTGEVIASDESRDHLNDGYYRPDVKVLWNGKSAQSIYSNDDPNAKYKSRESDLNEKDRSRLQSDLVFYRKSYKWFVFLKEQEEWKEIREPGFAGQEIYLGQTWKAEWDVPDFSLAPMEKGYYTAGEKWCYQNYDHEWFIYNPDITDWEPSYGLKADGVSPNDLKPYTGAVADIPVVRFDESSYYALDFGKNGYYKQGETVYYCYSNIIRSISEQWYRFDSEGRTWRNIKIKPVRLSKSDPVIVYYGAANLPDDFYEKNGITDIDKSGIKEQLTNQSGYYRQDKQVYYHYKNDWYTYELSRAVWLLTTGPSLGGENDTYLGSSYESDWNVSNFTSSSAWRDIQAKEAEERRQAERKRNNDSWSSDYDSWDSNDTDWDSDW